MIPLYICKSCGFISTRANEYIQFKGIRLCIDCKNDYTIDDSVTRWVNEAIEKG